VLVQFGSIYDYERTCAPRPHLTCGIGLTPTFDIDAREWRCISTCNNGQYDRAYSEGKLVCVPC